MPLICVDKVTGGTVIVRNGSAPQLTALNQGKKAADGLSIQLASKDVSRIWSNDNVNIRSMSPGLNVSI